LTTNCPTVSQPDIDFCAARQWSISCCEQPIDYQEVAASAHQKADCETADAAIKPPGTFPRAVGCGVSSPHAACRIVDRTAERKLHAPVRTLPFDRRAVPGRTTIKIRSLNPH
jgi:hypothetical protein